MELVSDDSIKIVFVCLLWSLFLSMGCFVLFFRVYNPSIKLALINNQVYKSESGVKTKKKIINCEHRPKKN